MLPTANQFPSSDYVAMVYSKPHLTPESINVFMLNSTEHGFSTAHKTKMVKINEPQSVKTSLNDKVVKI